MYGVMYVRVSAYGNYKGKSAFIHVPSCRPAKHTLETHLRSDRHKDAPSPNGNNQGNNNDNNTNNISDNRNDINALQFQTTSRRLALQLPSISNGNESEWNENENIELITNNHFITIDKIKNSCNS